MAVVETAGHGALMAVTHIFPAKELLLPGADWSQMSTPDEVGRLFDTCIGGFPTTTFLRILLFVACGNTTMPLVLPMAVFSSTRLLLPENSPMPKSSLGVA